MFSKRALRKRETPPVVVPFALFSRESSREDPYFAALVRLRDRLLFSRNRERLEALSCDESECAVRAPEQPLDIDDVDELLDDLAKPCARFQKRVYFPKS